QYDLWGADPRLRRRTRALVPGGLSGPQGGGSQLSAVRRRGREPARARRSDRRARVVRPRVGAGDASAPGGRWPGRSSHWLARLALEGGCRPGVLGTRPLLSGDEFRREGEPDGRPDPDALDRRSADAVRARRRRRAPATKLHALSCARPLGAPLAVSGIPLAFSLPS